MLVLQTQLRWLTFTYAHLCVSESHSDPTGVTAPGGGQAGVRVCVCVERRGGMGESGQTRRDTIWVQSKSAVPVSVRA